MSTTVAPRDWEGDGNAPKTLGSPAEALKELGSLRAGEKTKTAVERAARLAGLSYWRTFDIWYGKARRIEDSERASIAAALVKHRRRDFRDELQELRTRLATLEARFAQQDQALDTAEIVAGWALAGRAGGVA